MEVLGFSSDSLVGGLKRVTKDAVKRACEHPQIGRLVRKVADYGPIAVVAATSYPVGIACAMIEVLPNYIPRHPLEYVALGFGKYVVYQAAKTSYMMTGLELYSRPFPESKTAEFNSYLQYQFTTRVKKIWHRPLRGTARMLLDDARTAYHMVDKVDRYVYGSIVDLPEEYRVMANYAVEGSRDRIRRINYI